MYPVKNQESGASAQSLEQLRRDAVITEFAADPMLFSTALVVNLDAEVTSGTLTVNQFNSLVKNYFVALHNTPGNFAEKMATIYDASPQARPRLQAAAKRIRSLRRQSAQTEALLRKEEELIFE